MCYLHFVDGETGAKAVETAGTGTRLLPWVFTMFEVVTRGEYRRQKRHKKQKESAGIPRSWFLG